MVKTIGNPLSWGASALVDTAEALNTATEGLKSPSDQLPDTRILTASDLRQALRNGLLDFAHFRSDVMMLVVLYPVIGIALSYLAFHQNLLPLLFPLAAGFALIGPLAAIGLYELSRRREAKAPTSWFHAFAVLRPKVAGPVFSLGLALIALYALWLYAAAWIYHITLGPALPSSLSSFVTAVFTTPQGYLMMALGLSTGFVFALLTLSVSILSFPMLIERQVGLPVAVATSLKFSRQNPDVVMLWGAIVAVSLLLASLPLFLGLVFVLPILGHSTWHLYRKAVPPRP